MALLHYWNLQESSGTVADSVSGIDGTLDASISLGSVGPGGILTKAASFDGTSTTPITLDSTVQLLANEDWSVSFTAKQDAANLLGMVMGDSSTTSSFVWLTSSGGIDGIRLRKVGGSTGNDVDFPLSTAIRTKWTHYVLTHDASTTQVSLWVDGVLLESKNATGGVGLDVNVLGGGYTVASLSLDGGLCGVGLYQGVLSSSGIASLRAASSAVVDFSSVDKVVLVLGQSNADGRFLENQTYSNPTLSASVFEDGGPWSQLIDVGSQGQVWPLVATRWAADRGEKIGFIYAAIGGTGLLDPASWGAGESAYTAMLAAVTTSGVSKIDAMLWFQGEQDAVGNITEPAYAAAMNDLVARLHADLPNTPGPLLVGQIHNVGGSTDAIRRAQVTSWGNVNIKPGPVTYDMGPLVDNIHFKTDAEAVMLADRWWLAIDEALFDGTAGTPPKIVAAVSGGVKVTITYDRDLEPATNYTPDAWALDDNGSDISASLVTKTGPRTVVVLLNETPTSTALSIKLGAGNSAAGDDVPRGLGGQPALPESTNVIPTEHTPAWSVVRVKQIQRSWLLTKEKQ